MDPVFFLRGELSQSGLRAMRDQIDALLEGLDGPSQRFASGDGTDARAREKARALKGQLGENTWTLLHTAAENFPEEERFTFTDLARLLDADRSTIRAWHRGASKVINRLAGELGEEPEVLRFRGWDGEQNSYFMPKAMATAILMQGD